jgi:hypothetical protein
VDHLAGDLVWPAEEATCLGHVALSERSADPRRRDRFTLGAVEMDAFHAEAQLDSHLL